MIDIGRFTIERIEETTFREDTSLFPDWDDAAVAPIEDWFVGDYFDPKDKTFAMSVHSWLVRDGGTTILIDAGIGNGKPRPMAPRFDRLDTPFLDRLRGKGVRPEDVDYVMLTHLHPDHVGWNTVMRDDAWVPTFPNATYVMTETERYLRDPADGAKDRPAPATLPFLDSVSPVLARGNVRLVEGNEADFLPGLDFVPLPGHAPGMMGIRLRGTGQEALFVADVLHQPIQVLNPAWSSKFCEDRDLARQTREDVLHRAAETGCLVLPSHFGGTHCGYVRRDGDGYAYEPSRIAP